MFKNLRTSTKLVLLCAVFLVAVGATTYSSVAEKQINIAFARKELIGQIFGNSARYLFHGPERQSIRTPDAISATTTWGTMINAETMSEEKASLLYTSASPASGSIDALPS
jgi:hypothetical protein